MSDLFDDLNHEKSKHQNMTAPPDFEDRIRHALTNQKKKGQRKPIRYTLVASLLAILLVVAFNSQTLGFYGKQILGFNDVMSHNLKELNQAGKGQIIEQTYTFKDGIQVTLNGIMTDQNQLVAFLTLKSDTLDLTQYSLQTGDLTGFLTDSKSHGGIGKISDDKKEVKWEWDFTPPSFFAKKLTLPIELVGPDNYQDSGHITFNFDRAKAMPMTVQKNINQTLQLGQSSVTIKDLKASPMTTVITGRLSVPRGYSSRKTDSNAFELKVIANGKVVQPQSSEMTSTLTNRVHFSMNFEALPQPLKSLSVEIVKAPAHLSLNKTIPLSRFNEGTQVDVGGPTFQVVSKKVTGQQTTLVLKMADSVVLGGLEVQAGGERVTGSMSNRQLLKEKDGIKEVVTYTFTTTKKPDALTISDVYFSKTINKNIEIPVN